MQLQLAVPLSGLEGEDIYSSPLTQLPPLPCKATVFPPPPCH